MTNRLPSSVLRTALRILTLSALLTVPAHAAPIVTVEAWFEGTLTAAGMDVQSGHLIALPTLLDLPGAIGKTTFTAGPVLAVAFASGQTTYTLGEGQVDVVASWTGAEGPMSGTFSALVYGFDFVITESEDPLHATGEALGLLGPGVFDPTLSKALGVKPHTSGGDWHMFVDILNVLEPGPISRDIGTNQTLFHVSAAEVPEPSVLALLMLGGVSGIVRHRRRRTGAARLTGDIGRFYLPGVESTCTTRPPRLWIGRFVCPR